MYIYSFFSRNSYLPSCILNPSYPITYLRSLLDLSSSILPKLRLPLLLNSSPPRVFPISLFPAVLLSTHLLLFLPYFSHLVICQVLFVPLVLNFIRHCPFPNFPSIGCCLDLLSRSCAPTSSVRAPQYNQIDNLSKTQVWFA